MAVEQCVTIIHYVMTQYCFKTAQKNLDKVKKAVGKKLLQLQRKEMLEPQDVKKINHEQIRETMASIMPANTSLVIPSKEDFMLMGKNKEKNEREH